MGCSKGACMHACSLHRGNHSPWSPLNCQKTDTAPEVTHWRSIGSICRHAGLKLVKRRPVHHHLRPYLQSWTLAAQSLPYLQASRRRNALRDTSRGRVRAQGLRKPHSRAHQTYRTIGHNNKDSENFTKYYVTRDVQQA